MSRPILPNGTTPRQVSTSRPLGLLPAAIYARVSTQDQADKGFSLPTQIEACLALAQREGYTVPETHIFMDDYTGTSLNRPQFKHVRDLVQQRLVQAVIVHDLDRLSRKLAHQLLLSEGFEQAGVALHIVTMPDGAKTPETQLLATVRSIIAEYEHAQILERTARGRRGRAQAGHVPYGRRTLGYTYVKHADKGAHYEVYAEEAALVQRIFRLYLEGGSSLHTIAALLTNEGIPTPKDQMRTLPARVWHPSTIASMLRNTAYIGTLNRPRLLNAYNDTMGDELLQAHCAFDQDDHLHVLIISGAGRAFCSGADVKQRQLRSADELKRLGGPAGGIRPAGGLLGLGQTVNWKPVIAAVHGYVLGAGFGLAMATDLIVAAAGTKFQIREVQRGIAGAQHWATTWFWGGGRLATKIALTGRYFSAEEAHQLGMVNRVVPQDQVLAEAERLAQDILANPPLSVRANVRVSRWFARRMEEAATYYTGGLKLHLTEDFRESAQAFIEKRPPNFKGR